MSISKKTMALSNQCPIFTTGNHKFQNPVYRNLDFLFYDFVFVSTS